MGRGGGARSSSTRIRPQRPPGISLTEWGRRRAVLRESDDDAQHREHVYSRAELRSGFQESATCVIAPDGRCQAQLPYGQDACWAGARPRQGHGSDRDALAPDRFGRAQLNHPEEIKQRYRQFAERSARATRRHYELALAVSDDDDVVDSSRACPSPIESLLRRHQFRRDRRHAVDRRRARRS